MSADGLAFSTVTVTLEDASSNPSPGKQVILSQGGGHSNISGPASGVTDSTGKIQFTVTDKIAETVTYTATDVSDGNLPVPGSAPVDFSGGTPPTCSLGMASVVAGQPFAIGQWATGFETIQYQNLCFGPTGMAFDPTVTCM